MNVNVKDEDEGGGRRSRILSVIDGVYDLPTHTRYPPSIGLTWAICRIPSNNLFTPVLPGRQCVGWCSHRASRECRS